MSSSLTRWGKKINRTQRREEVKNIFSQIVPAKKYQWCKNDNGTFTIFQVEIFRTFEDEQRGKIGEEGLDEIVENFEKEKAAGWYPRIHAGHHDRSTENLDGVGYLDNFSRVGQVIFADFAEIEEEDFQDFLKKKYPGRSVEFDDEKMVIDTLAVLKSQCPYFKFPMLYLEEEPTKKLNAIQQELYQKRQFALPYLEKSKMLFFSKLKNKFQDGDPEDTPPVDPEVTPGDDEKYSKFQGELDGLGERMSKMEESIQKMMDHLGYQEDPSEPEPDATPGDPDKDYGPSSVAMQKMKAEMENQRKAFQKQIDDLRKEQKFAGYEEKVKMICDRDPSRNSEALMSTLKRFSSDKDRDTYLDLELKRVPQGQGFHPATQFSKNFDFPEVSEIRQRFSKETPKMQQVASWAYQDYFDTINQADERAARKFQKKYPTWSSYVDEKVRREKMVPGHYELESGRKAE